MHALQPITLEGHMVRLEPLCEDHKEGLYEAAQDKKIWAYIYSKAYGTNFDAWFKNALQSVQHGGLSFAVICAKNDKIVGSTRYYDVFPLHARLTIGYTWYMPELWGTAVNPECKYLLLKHAFEVLKINRVEFFTDTRNTRSQSAIKKLGAFQEGILRQHMIMENGFVRDSVLFSLIKSDWPTAKLKLEHRLKHFKS